MTSPEELEAALKQSLIVYHKLDGSRKRKERELAEFNLGQAAGIMKTLSALGHDDWNDRIINELQEESDEKWAKTEGGQLMTGADQWMGRKVYQWGRGRPPYPGAG
jgi:hypothetical protein